MCNMITSGALQAAALGGGVSVITGGVSVYPWHVPKGNPAGCEAYSLWVGPPESCAEQSTSSFGSPGGVGLRVRMHCNFIVI